MEALALYLLKVHVGISVLYTVYYLTVKNENFFRLNRFMLLAILLFSFILPLLPSSSLTEALSTASTNVGPAMNAVGPSGPTEVAKFDDEIQIRRLSGILTSFMAFYLCAVFFLICRFFNQVSNVGRLIERSDKVREGSISFSDPGENIAPFSFFNAIVINRDQHNEEEFEQIIAHEKAHVRQFHSVDIFFAELTSVILCGNPFARAIKDTIRMNLEFLADEDVLKRGFDKESYQWSIVAPYMRQHVYPLTNLYNSKPKQRIERMNTPQKSLIHLYKYTFIIPVFACLYIWISPFHASALDKIDAMKRMNEHEYRDYLGYYEFEDDKGSFVRISMKGDALVMNTLWNNKKIYFQKKSENRFINSETNIPLVFPRTFEGAVKRLVAFGDDEWVKVPKYTPMKKRSGEGTVISRTSSGAMQVLVYAIEPWANVKHYEIGSKASSP
jgi:hypothetical protein